MDNKEKMASMFGRGESRGTFNYDNVVQVAERFTAILSSSQA